MQLACTSLWAGDCDTAVAGGLNVMTNSDIFAGLSRGQFLSKTGNCQTFDNDADGCKFLQSSNVRMHDPNMLVQIAEVMVLGR